MTWARRLKKVFSIDISECEKCKRGSEDHCLYRRPRGHKEDPGPPEGQGNGTGIAHNLATQPSPPRLPGLDQG